MLDMTGRLPDALVACVGGGSNAIGLFIPFSTMPMWRSTASRRPVTASPRASRGAAVCRQTGRAAWQPHLPDGGQGRPDHRDAFDLGGLDYPVSALSMPG